MKKGLAVKVNVIIIIIEGVVPYVEGDYCKNNTNPCKVGGTCNSSSDNSSEYSCQCLPGRYSVNCELVYCGAYDNPCQNGGTCSSRPSNSHPEYGFPFYECSCLDGYYRVNCTSSVDISSPESTIAIVGERLIIQLNITSSDFPVHINITKNEEYVDAINITENGTTSFYMNATYTSAGSYRFTAFSEDIEDLEYARETNVELNIRAFIKNVSLLSIYSPGVLESSKSVNCSVDGIPTPSKANFGWYRGEIKVNESKQDGVYQQIYDTYALLYVDYAQPSDDGVYRCNASNIVGNEAIKSEAASELVKLSVYRAPTSLNLTSMACSALGKINVTWTPDERTKNINHTFYATPINESIPSIELYNFTAKNGQPVSFNELRPYTEYEISVEVCPSHSCIKKFNKSARIVTGHGLPEAVNNVKISNANDTICEVTWDKISTPNDQIERFEILWNASANEAVGNDVAVLQDTGESGKNNNYELMMNSPNKRYFVRVQAWTCAGVGESTEAIGNCITKKDVPSFVPEPEYSTDQNNERRQTRDVTISMIEDESNGSISCLFVVLFKNGLKETKQYVVEDLKKFSENALNEKTVEYIALAIKRSDTKVGERINSTLGNNMESSCNIYDISKRSRRSTENRSGDIKARNLALDFNEISYAMIVITTTPINATFVKLQVSRGVEFSQGQVEFLLYPVAYILCPLALIAIAVLLYFCLRRSKAKKDGKENPVSENSGYRNPSFSSPDRTVAFYENTEIRKTDIAFSDLKRHYLLMSADENMRFREQYSELKRIARASLLPSEFGSSDEAMVKNRFKNILPFDSTRVTLSGEGLETYINACYIKGYKKSFIAAQGPLPNTIEDFWRMIVEQKCQVIVMLTKCEENRKTKCSQYWPSLNQSVSYGPYVITNVCEEDTGGIIRREISVELPGKENQTVNQYQYVWWPDHGIPTSTSAFYRLHKMVVAKSRVSVGESIPIVVHCSAGVGRTGTFIAFDILLGESKDSVDVFNCVLNLRQQRVDMVQTTEQYQFLHKLMLENFLFGETDVLSDNLENARKLSRLSEEFQNLQEAESLNSKQQYTPGNQTNITIVRQPEDTEWVTIDAKFVESYRGRIKLIASKGPSNSTVEFFLRAVWDNGVDMIVMLNDPDYETEDPEAQYATYWPEQTGLPITYGSVTIELVQERKANGVMDRTLRLSRRNQDPRDIKQLHYKKWQSELLSSQQCLDIINIINQINNIDQDKPATVMVHCTDGLGRTGAFLAVTNIVARLEVENFLDVFRTVKDLRDVRPGMVKTLAQYKLCYDLAECAMSQNNIYVNEDLDKTVAVDDPLYENCDD